jgi:hypothetical protein
MANIGRNIKTERVLTPVKLFTLDVLSFLFINEQTVEQTKPEQSRISRSKD